MLAVIEQESGFEANPAVPGLARIVQQRLEAYADKLGPLGPPTIKALLEGKAPGHSHTFEQRLAQRASTPYLFLRVGFDCDWGPS